MSRMKPSAWPDGNLACVTVDVTDRDFNLIPTSSPFTPPDGIHNVRLVPVTGVGIE